MSHRAASPTESTSSDTESKIRVYSLLSRSPNADLLLTGLEPILEKLQKIVMKHARNNKLQEELLEVQGETIRIIMTAFDDKYVVFHYVDDPQLTNRSGI
jgi:hypothetical protein